ncbi:hypothetical protein TBLA_0H00820 [Henningerozyma blattae CBS 6284]|uniref:SET domain-containing protein n=1 Tax=Henningerozyma blattae (strain ATCC 34711 / CBS 6284 / DSM 70876 / NBRC 10599 / NRRL Y-10934 / UCD 77-7) TaxID=1071380 RepID=I2H7L9_HENB6|nr:hypothetical protein TBLA_0H00820 [Tetrapisispora blattae CBS 6284]CCH62371.1 hypothetical protein TBLA_0H00820 [Tetrapisispora blattae CBS 6284]
METKIGKLLTWLNESPSFNISSKIGIHETPHTGRGVILTNDKLHRNEVIISVPSTHQLNFHTVLYHISKYNTDINLLGITIPRSTENDKNYLKDLNRNDPRFFYYSQLSQEFLVSLSSFQLLSLYILSEWILLPYWSQNNSSDEYESDIKPIQSFWQPFFDVWPTKLELSSFPAIWDCDPDSYYKYLLEYLPFETSINYKRISNLIQIDWKVIQPVLSSWIDHMNSQQINNGLNCVLPTISDLYYQFLHIYTIINSRCLYAEVPLKSDDVKNNFTLVPYVDFLNHTSKADGHCIPSLNKLKKVKSCGIGEFQIRCGSMGYKMLKEEIFLNYGAHSNDFLLNEYGFVISDDKNLDWNFVNISNSVESLLENNSKMIKFLKENDYWGEYTINYDSISYRTLIALSLLVTKDVRRVEKLMQGLISEEFFLPKINLLLKSILTNYKTKYTNNLDYLLRTPIIEENTFCRQNVISLIKGTLKIIDHHLESM